MALPVLMAWLCATGSRAAPAADTGTQLPHLEKRGNAIQLLVDGQPYLMLAGELHNSVLRKRRLDTRPPPQWR